jgi:hypothetical protein
MTAETGADAGGLCKFQQIKGIEIIHPHPGIFRKVVYCKGLHNFAIRKSMKTKDEDCCVNAAGGGEGVRASSHGVG